LLNYFHQFASARFVDRFSEHGTDGMCAKLLPVLLKPLGASWGLASNMQGVAEVLGQEARAFQRQRKLGWERALLAKALVEQAGLTQREAAAVMGLKTGAAVSIQLRRLHEALPEDAKLRRQVREIESRLLP
jgi:hypothetical protein